MSSTIDQRIVEMQFDNQRFERNVSTSISTLDKLKQALRLDAASKGLDSIEKGFSKLNLSGVGSAVDTIASRFSALGIIGTTILQDIGHRAFQAGQQILGMIKSMTLDQVTSGWSKYAEKTNSVKTIMSATGQTWQEDADTLKQLNALTEQGFDPKNASTYLQTWKDVNSGIINTTEAAKQLGITVQEFQEKTQNFGEVSGLKYAGSQMDYVNSQMEKMNWFTDETSYNFADMVNNVGKFTANNIPLSQATTAMQGIANWAAISGQNASTASRAMYNMAQAIGVGSVKLMDWKSIENANMATAEFKKQAIEMAVANGTLKKSFDKTGKAIYKTTSNAEVTVENFSQTLASGWFNKNVLLSTLDKYGAFTDKLYEFSQATDLTATETLQLIDAQKEGTISVEKYRELAEDAGMTVDEFKKSLSELGSEQYAFGRSTFEAAQQATSFQDAIEATKDAASTKWLNIFENIFGDYEKARKIWTGFAEFLYDTLVAPLEQLEDLSKIVGEVNAVERLAGAFKNIFDLFKGDGIDTFGIIDAIGKGFKSVFPPIENTRLALGKALTAFTKWTKGLKKGIAFYSLEQAAKGAATVLKALGNTFTNLWSATEPLCTAFSGLVSSLVTFASNFLRAGKYIDKTGIKFDWLKTICEKLATVVGKVSKAFKNVKVVDITNAFSKLASVIQVIRQSFANIWESTEPVRTSLTGLGEAIWNLFGRLFDIGEGFELTEYKAEGLKQACQKLSEIIDAVSKAINELSVEKIQEGFAKVVEVVNKVREAFSKFIDSLRSFKLGSSVTVAIDWIKDKFQSLKEFLSKFDLGKAIKGGLNIGIIAALGAGLIKLIKFIKNPLSALDGIKEKIEGILDSIGELAGAKIDGAMEGLKKFSASILMLAAALLILGFVNYENAIYGIGVIAGAIVAFMANLQAFEKIKATSLAKLAGVMITLSVSMLVFAVALGALAGAVTLFALVAKIDTVWSGLLVMAGALTIVSIAMYALSKISPKVFIGAAALMVLAGALIVLAGAVALFTLVAQMKNLGTGLYLMAATLGVLSIALIALGAAGPKGLIGAAALFVVAGALIVLAGALAAFSLVATMEGAGAGLLLLAGMIAVLTVALAALTPVALGAIGVAAAMLGISAACLILAAAIGVVSLVLPLLGTGLQLLAEGVSTGLSALGTGIATFGLGIAALIMQVSNSIAVGVESIIVSVGTGIGVAIAAIGTGIGDAISAAAEGVGTAISTIAANVSISLEALGEGISGFGAGIGGLVSEVMSGVALGVEALVASVGNGIANGINAISDSISNFSTGLSDVGSGIAAFGDGIRTLDGISWAKTALGIGEISLALKNLKVDNLGSDLASAADGVVASCTSMVTSLSTAIEQAGTFAKTGGAKIVTSFASGIKSKSGSARSAGTSISNAAVQGMSSSSGYTIGQQAAQGFINGFLSKELTAGEAGKRIAKMAYEKAKAELQIGSPSRLFHKLGGYTTQGFINGMMSLQENVGHASESISQTAISSVVDTMASISDMMDANPEFTPTIRPVLDSTSLAAGLKMVKALNSDTSVTTTLSARDLSELQNGRALLANALSNVNSSTEHAESIKFTPKDAEEFIAIGNKIIDYIKDGHDLYFDDGAFAGRIDRRLGAI